MRRPLAIAAVAVLATGVGVGVRIDSTPAQTLVIAAFSKSAPSSPVGRQATTVTTTAATALPATALTDTATAADVDEPGPDPAWQPAEAPGDCSNIPAWFPPAIAWRESNCRYDVTSAGAVYFGAFQIAAFHWETGSCADLDWTVPAAQDECAWRLSQGGTDFSPWGA